jgi:coniferyl-aldehyde dehydrogenase
MLLAMNAAIVQTRLDELLAQQRAAFRRNPYPDHRERSDHLHRLERALLAAQDEAAAALDGDFGGRSKNEILFSELFVALHAIRHARKHLKSWMRERPRKLDWPLQPATAWVMPQPLGVAGIISPWNYPLFLTFAPLAGALAAGNRVLIKPSEITPRTSECIAKIVAQVFAADHVAVVTGDAEVARAFAALPFDHLLFTGSTAVGREVMRAAAANLTPVTLELGGKSPAIVAPDADLRRAAEDIAYAKFLNAGQTCIAPDYALVPRDRLQAFASEVRGAVERYWPDPPRNPDYTSVVNGRHRSRLQSYLDEARAGGVEVSVIGSERGDPHRVAPVLLLDPPDHLRVMQDEIFGPLLPVKTYGTLERAVEYVNDRPRPLALYLFTKSRETEQYVLTHTLSGGASVNETLVYIAAEDLPFGGVGASGLGHYHGQDGFDTFSKLKPVFRRRWPGLSRSLRPPYRGIHRLMKRILVG